jgi:cytidylate kinase
MSVITISRGSYSYGKEVAEKVARRLGHRCIARELLLETSEQFNIPEVKLLEAVAGAPSFWDRIVHGKDKYMAFIQVALLREFRKDNVVYHGLAGHFFAKGVPHVLKVRIIADFEERVRIVMKRDGVQRKEAVRFLERIDEERKSWGRHLYGIDSTDPGLYDLVIHIGEFTADDATDVIIHSVNLESFRTTPQSRQMMDDLALAAEIKGTLIDKKPDVEVSVKDGNVEIRTKAHLQHEGTITREIKSIVSAMQGVRDVKVHILPVTPFDL